MKTQNNPQQPTGLVWVYFCANLNPQQPKITQENKNGKILAVFAAFLEFRMPLGYFRKKKEKKKEPKKKINKNTGCWIKDFGIWI